MNGAFHLSLALLVCGSAGALANTEAADAAAKAVTRQLERHTHSFDSRASKKLEKDLKLPDAVDVRCGSFRTLAGKDTKACFTRSTKSGKWESFIIDLNRNDDLTDDPVRPMPSRSREKLTIEHDGRSYAFNVSAYQNRSYARVSLHAVEGTSGSLSLNGEDIAWIVCDCNLSGQLDAGDTALFDMDGDGRFGDHRKDTALVIGPGSALFRNNAWYSISAGDGNRSLTPSPYAGKLARLSIDTSKLKKAGNTPHDILLYAPDEKRHSLPGVVPSDGVEVPVCTYAYIGGSIKTEPSAIDYHVRNITVETDTVMTLELPESKLSVRQSDGKVHVSQKVVAEGGFKFRLARGKPGPLVEIFSEETPDEPVTKGNMAYG